MTPPKPQRRRVNIDSSQLYRPVIKEFTCVGRHYVQSAVVQVPTKPFQKVPVVCRSVGEFNEFPVMTARQAMNIALDNSSSAGFGGGASLTPRSTTGDSEVQTSDESPSISSRMVTTPILFDKVTHDKIEELEEETGIDINDHVTVKTGVFKRNDLWLFPLSQRKSISHQTLGLADEPTSSPSRSKSKSKNDATASSASNKKRMDELNQPFILARTTRMKYGVSKRTIQCIENDKETIAKSTNVNFGVAEIEIISREERVKMENDQDNSSTSTSTNSTRKPHGTAMAKMYDDVAQDRPPLEILSNILNTKEEPPTWSEFVKDSKDYLNAMDKAYTRLEKNMVKNANFLREEFENDFFNRTTKGAEKVIGSMGTNVIRMQKTISSMYNWWGGGNDEGDHEK